MVYFFWLKLSELFPLNLIPMAPSYVPACIRADTFFLLESVVVVVIRTTGSSAAINDMAAQNTINNNPYFFIVISLVLHHYASGCCPSCAFQAHSVIFMSENTAVKEDSSGEQA